MAPPAFRQVVGDSDFSPKSVRPREVCWKNGLTEEPSESAGGASWLAVPGAGWDGRAGRRRVGQDRPGQERQLWEALAGLLRVHDLACRAQHLLGRQGELLDRPAVAAGAPGHHTSRGDLAPATAGARPVARSRSAAGGSPRPSPRPPGPAPSFGKLRTNSRSSTSTSVGCCTATARVSSTRRCALGLGSFGSARTSPSGTPNRCAPKRPTRAMIPSGIAGTAFPTVVLE